MKFLMLLFSLALAAKPEMKSLENSFGTLPPDPKTIQISVISDAEAQKLFQKFLADKSIPFRYPEEGCEERATAMALVAEKENVVVGKLFIQGDFLYTHTRYPLYPKVKWRRHVVPVVYVRDGMSEPVLRAFDPSLFDGPVSVDEVVKRVSEDVGMGEPYVSEFYYGSKYQSHMKEAEPYKSRWGIKYLFEVRKTLRGLLPAQDDPRKRPPPRYLEGAVTKKKSRVPAAKSKK